MTASVKHRKRPPTSVSPQGDTKHQAEYLSHTRREHANEVAEDYVEAIADLVSTSRPVFNRGLHSSSAHRTSFREAV